MGKDRSSLLEQHRRDIEALDRRVLHLVRERQQLAAEVGELKRSQGIPLRDFEVEAEVHERFRQGCRDLGLDPALGHDLAVFLIERSAEQQAAVLDTVYQGNHLRCLVIGGKGGMGSWTAAFLGNQGHEVVIYDPAPGDSPYQQVETLQDGSTAQLIVVAVPMTDCAMVLDELASFGSDAVVAEMCSLKAHLEPTKARLRSAGMRIVSFHPLFGPDTRMLDGRVVLFCDDAPPEDLAVVKGLFESTTATLIDLDPAEHDRRMGLVLGMTHLSNFVFARGLSRSGVASDELREVAGVTYQKQMATTLEVSRENPHLYHQIQTLNDITPDTARWLTESIKDYVEASAGEDPARFVELMTEGLDYLQTVRAS